MKKKVIRVTTVALSLDKLIEGQLRFLNQFYDVVAVSGKDHHLELVEQREGVRVIDLSMQRPISPVRDAISIWKMYWLLRKEKPQIIHSMTPKAGLVSMVAGKLAGVPIRMHTFTGLVFPTRKGIMQKLLIWIDRLICKCATHIYPEGNGVRQDLIIYNVTSKPLKILANGNINGLDTQRFDRAQHGEEVVQLKAQLGLTQDHFVYSFVGRLVGDKGINELVEAFVRVHVQYPNVRLVLVGPREEELDPLTPQTEAKIEQMESIVTVGYQNDVRPYLALSDAFVFPSYREGFPNVVLQAGAYDLPSVVTDINGSNEIITHGLNGLIIPKGDADALEQAMLKLYADTDLRTHLAANARSLIVQRYEQSIVWQAIHQEYERLVR